MFLRKLLFAVYSTKQQHEAIKYIFFLEIILLEALFYPQIFSVYFF